MTPAAARLLQAEADAALARQRLQITIGRLQARLDPKLLAQNAKDAATDAGQASIDTIRRNPVPAAGVATALGLLLVRRPIARLFRRKPADPHPAPVLSEPAVSDPSIPESQA